MLKTYLDDPVIEGHLDRRLMLMAQLTGSAQSQIISAYWTLAQHGKVSATFVADARKYLRDVLELLETV